MSDNLEAQRPRVTEVVGSQAEKRKRIVMVGGGFAGIAAAHALRHADAEVLMIDRRNHHIFQPLLYRWPRRSSLRPRSRRRSVSSRRSSGTSA